MKKYLLLSLFLTASLTAFADKVDVKLEEVTTLPINPRSIVHKPTATIDAERCEISVKFFDTSESFTLCVEDCSGNVVYQAPLSADPSADLHLLGDLENGEYTLRIENEKRSFVGNFEI